MPRRRRRRRRGYYVAVLIGLEKSQAHIWNVFKESVKAVKQIKGDGGYSFYEAIVDIIRPSVKQGVKSILVATTDDKDYQTFMNHIRKHQSWLLHGWTLNTVTFEHIPGRAANRDDAPGLHQR